MSSWEEPWLAPCWESRAEHAAQSCLWHLQQQLLKDCCSRTGLAFLSDITNLNGEASLWVLHYFYQTVCFLHWGWEVPLGCHTRVWGDALVNAQQKGTGFSFKDNQNSSTQNDALIFPALLRFPVDFHFPSSGFQSRKANWPSGANQRILRQKYKYLFWNNS